MDGLFDAFARGPLQLDNRIVVAPMAQYQAVDGCATDWHLIHLGMLASSGAGLVITGSAHVEPEGRITTGCLGLYDDATEQALGRVIAACQRYGSARTGVQIAHAGRKGSSHLPWNGRNRPLQVHEGAWQTWGCSGAPRAAGWPRPRPLQSGELIRVRDRHADAAGRAARIGADLVEVTMAHGYLLHEFLSPLTNTRTDAYGGGLHERLRFPIEVFEAVREVWPADRPLGVRISSTDHVPGGWDLDASIVLVQALQERGCDYVSVSSGGLSLEQRIPLGEAHQVPDAAEIRRRTGMTTMAAGMIFDPRVADRVVADGDADLVALARAFLVDPHWPWFAASVLGHDVDHPAPYLRGYRSRWHREQRLRTPGIAEAGESPGNTRQN